MTRCLFYMRVFFFFFFWGGGGGGLVTGNKIVATIVAKSGDTLNTITRHIRKFFEIYPQGSEMVHRSTNL